MCAVLAVLNSVNYITLFMPGCFVLRMEFLKFLPQRACQIKSEAGYDVY